MRPAPQPAPTGAAEHFLHRYVTSDGRVIRRDQGGDVTSEGQAYGMLVAQSAGRPELARAIWSWTEAHLARPDGLLSWRAQADGTVSDRESAADADVLAAYALLRHSGPESAELHRAGARLAASVLRSEAVALPGGAPIPVAGPWAKRKPEPVVNPSYLMPGVFAALSRLTGEASWSSAARAAVDLVSALTRQGRRLPPDWARLRGARLVAAFKPGGRRQVRFGLDAARLPIWFAGAHGDAARRLAASWWEHVLSSKRDHLEASALALFGAVIDERPSPVGLLAGAAAAGAAGDLAAAGALRRRARELGAAAPTYYGDAWAALAPALLGGRM